jgi:hypothetical protein
MRWTLAVVAPFALFDLKPGEIVTVEPGAPEPICVHGERPRVLPPNYGAILDALGQHAVRILRAERTALTIRPLGRQLRLVA